MPFTRKMKIVIFTIISIICHYAVPKTIEYYPRFQSRMKCSECYRIYFPLCATDNQTYTNECRFRCIMSKKRPVNRATIRSLWYETVHVRVQLALGRFLLCLCTFPEALGLDKRSEASGAGCDLARYSPYGPLGGLSIQFNPYLVKPTPMEVCKYQEQCKVSSTQSVHRKRQPLLMFVITIFIISQYVVPKTVENYPPFQSNLKCNECLRIYFPLCASDNKTYTNECRFRCVQSKRRPAKRATIIRYGPCIMGQRRSGNGTNITLEINPEDYS